MRLPRTRLRRAKCLASVATTVVLATACGHEGDAASTERGPTGSLPATLHGMDRMQLQAGPEAAALVGRLHRAHVAPDDTHIGRYGTGPRHITLYVSRFASADEADSALRQMVMALGEGSSGFAHHRTLVIDTTALHRVLGHGQVHFFYVRGTTLNWLAIAPEMARGGLAELLQLPRDAVPPLDTLLASP